MSVEELNTKQKADEHVERSGKPHKAQRCVLLRFVKEFISRHAHQLHDCGRCGGGALHGCIVGGVGARLQISSARVGGGAQRLLPLARLLGATRHRFAKLLDEHGALAIFMYQETARHTVERSMDWILAHVVPGGVEDDVT